MEEAGTPEFPGFTEWQRRTMCCCVDTVHIAKLGVNYVGHWECRPLFPIIVNFIIASSYIIAMLSCIPLLSFPFRIFSAIIISVLYFLFTYSYFRVIIDGPGFFPFYWPMKHEDESNESNFLLDDLSPSGIISSDAQYKWCRMQKHPPRCILSSIGRRIVIRPDHFCEWTASWIGKRNYKFFVLFNMWGAIYILFFIVVAGETVFIYLHNEPSGMIAVLFAYIMLGLVFFSMTLNFSVEALQNAADNRTQWEIWNKIDQNRYNIGDKISNLEDVFGSKEQMCLWLCPISPWSNVSNQKLIENYTDYFDIL